MNRSNRPVNPLRQAPSGILESLMAKAELHQSLESLILSELPDRLAARCRFAGYRNGELTLIVPDSTAASQLRFHQRSLLERLRRDERFQQAWRVRARVAVWHEPAPRPERAPPHLSKKNARLLEEVAGHTEDQGLKQVLLRLSANGTEPGSQDGRN